MIPNSGIYVRRVPNVEKRKRIRHYRPMNTKRQPGILIPSTAIQISISEEMRNFAAEVAKNNRIRRHECSENGGYIGALGEAVWCLYRYGSQDWKSRALDIKPGSIDDNNPLLSVEIKTSKVASPGHCHLVVKEEYTQKRRPDVYTQIFLLSSEADFEETVAYIMGFATHDQVTKAPLERPYISKLKKYQDYFTFRIPVAHLSIWPEPFD